MDGEGDFSSSSIQNLVVTMVPIRAQQNVALVIGVIRVPQNVVVFTSPQENVRRLWTNAQFQFCINNCEGKYWEHNCKAFKEANWKEFIKQLNVKFLDVQWSWKQV
jgi:hypothetical protein